MSATILVFASQLLKYAALLVLDKGLRAGEAVNLEWADMILEPANGARYGYLRVRKGKSKNAKRNVSLTTRVRGMLIDRHSKSNSEGLSGRDIRPISCDVAQSSAYQDSSATWPI